MRARAPALVAPRRTHMDSARMQITMPTTRLPASKPTMTGLHWSTRLRSVERLESPESEVMTAFPTDLSKEEEAPDEEEEASGELVPPVLLPPNSCLISSGVASGGDCERVWRRFLKNSFPSLTGLVRGRS